MKERKKIIIKVFVPIFIICIIISGMHYYQLVEKNIKKTLENMDVSSSMFAFYSRINEDHIDIFSDDFEKEYERISKNHYQYSYVFKSILDEDRNIQRFDMVGTQDFSFQMMIGNNENSYNLDLSLLNDKQLLQVVDILKKEYKNKIIVEVAGEKTDAVHEGTYIPESIVASYLKINEQVIIEGDDSAKIDAYFNMYQDKDNVIITGYNWLDESIRGEFGKYIDIANIRNNVATIIEEDKNAEKEWNREQKEIGDDYYLYTYFTLYDGATTLRPKYLLAVTVIPDLRKNISQEVFNDSLFLYITMIGLLFVALISLQYFHWNPTKKVLTTISEMGGKAENLKQVSTYVEVLEAQYHQDIEQLKQECSILEQQVLTYQPKGVIECKDTNKVVIMVHAIVERYRLLLDNKKIKADITVLSNRLDDFDKYQDMFNSIFNILVYQIKVDKTIEVVINQEETRITVSDMDFKNNDTIQELFKKHQYIYKIDIINDKNVLSFYPQTNL